MRTVAGVFAAGVLLLSAASADAAPKPAPDLAISSFGNPPTSVQRGGSFTVRDQVSNRGTKPAKASATKYYLSLDKRLSPADVLLGQRSVPRLKHGRRSRATTKLTVPADTPPGTYRLLACADAGKRLREKSERNNCQPSAKTLQVTAEQQAAGPASSPQGGGETMQTPPAGEAGSGSGDGGPVVTPLGACVNGIDDDGDGPVDMADPGCWGPTDKNELGPELCNGGIDDDADPTTPENGAAVPPLPNMTGRCIGGAPSYTCVINYWNIDGIQANGCEYYAVFISPTETCNGVDENANGQIDEAVVPPAAVPHGTWSCSGVGGWVLTCEPGYEDSDPNTPGCEAIEP